MVNLPDHRPDWDPRAPAVLRDQIQAYDHMRQRCPVAHSEYLHWSLFRHADVLRVLHDPETFGNAVSTHVSVPNGMDPPEHTAWRALIEPYFAPAQLAAFEPVARGIAHELVAALPESGEVEWMDGFAQDGAVRLLCAFMGWPASLHAPLREWSRRNQAATLAGDRAALAAIAFEFDGHIRAQLARCRAMKEPGQDLTSRLLRERVHGRPVRDEAIVSILRNWTVGELTTLAACFGILVQFLAQRQDVQRLLRADPSLLPAAIDEILRIHPPLIANRRMVRRPTEIGGRKLAPGERVTVMWASANRDEAVFGDPDEFRLDRDPKLNLLYGAGLHACPGAELSRMQLRIVMEALLAGTKSIVPGHEGQAEKACYPASGFARLAVRVEKAG
jgi:cytochrome P450